MVQWLHAPSHGISLLVTSFFSDWSQVIRLIAYDSKLFAYGLSSIGTE